MMELDHLAITCADLAEGTAWAESLLGVPLEPGGQHPRFATHNRLLSLGSGLYLEVIAPDLSTTPQTPRWFDLDNAGAPRLAHWIARTPNLAAALAEAPPEAGQPLDLTRGRYAWTVTVPPDGSLPWSGAYPTLLQWREGGHPSDALPDRGVRLLSLEVGHPRAPRLKSLLHTLQDPRVTIITADHPTLRACLSTPNGEVTL